MRTKELFAFIKERHAIYERRQAGQLKPWTKDPILQKYKFCNVYRELDRVTVWIRENWREPYWKDTDLWFAMAVARLINWPPTLEVLGYSKVWTPEKFIRLLQQRQEAKVQVFGSAYIVSTNGRAMNKVEYLAKHVLNPLWEVRRSVKAAINTKSLAQVHRVLCETQGIGSFIGAQIIADIRMVPPLDHATDRDTWAASGPGSRRGLNRVYGHPKDIPMSETTWLHNLQLLETHIRPLLKKASMPAMHLQDLQNCLCEFDKYERVRLNEGRPKSLYDGGL